MTTGSASLTLGGFIMLQQFGFTDFMNRKKVGLILRVFATDPADIPKRIKMIEEFVDQAQVVALADKPVFKRIDVLVWADPSFGDQSDCGQTTAAMREALVDRKNVHVSEVKRGDLFCGLLNYGIALQSRHGVDYSMIASGEARDYLNDDTVKRMIDALCKGALVTGVAINELTDSILEGRIANTLAIWHNVSLMTVGSFDLSAAKPVDMRFADYKRGWSKEREAVVYYHTAGVEELIPLARLIDLVKGPCIAPVLPMQDGGEVRYEAPDRAAQPDLWERHISKMGTKLERQTAHLARIHCDISYIKGGVMPEFCQF